LRDSVDDAVDEDAHFELSEEKSRGIKLEHDAEEQATDFYNIWPD
jgi:hypothetical protein